MTLIVVSPLARIAEMAVRHKAREMVSLMSKEQFFHRPAVIKADRHLLLTMNDIVFKGTGNLIAPEEVHVRQLIAFAAQWDQTSPLLIHCWMGVSRSPAAAIVTALFLYPDQSETAVAQRLRTASPFATPNARLIEIADAVLDRRGRLVDAVRALGRGAFADGNAPFVFRTYEDGCSPTVDGRSACPILGRV